MGSALLTLAAIDTEPAPQWDGAMLWDAKRRNSTLVPIVRIMAPGGDVLISTTSVPSRARGQYRALVLEGGMPSVSEGISSLLSHGLESERLEIEIDDTAGDWAAIVRGVNAHLVRGCAVQIELASWDTDQASWPVIWIGKVVGWPFPRAKVARVAIQRDDLWLLGQTRQSTVNTQVWPKAHADAVNQPYPIVGGGWDSTTITDKGALPTLYVDTRNKHHRYMIAAAHLLSPQGYVVYGSTSGIISSGYTITYPVAGGDQVTLIDFTTNSHADETITADAFGYSTLADGSGSAIATPLAILKHILVNWVWAQYRRGDWIDEATSPLDLESWREMDDYLQGANTMRPAGSACSGRGGSHRAGDRPTGLTLLNAACVELGLYPFWERGKLALGTINHRRRRSYYDGWNWLRGDVEELGQSFDESKLDDSNLTDRITASYSADAAAQKKQSGLTVADLSVGVHVERGASITWDEMRAETTANLTLTATTLDDGFTLVGGATVHGVLGDGSDSSYARWPNAGTPGSVRVTAAPMPAATSVIHVRLAWRAKYTANGGGARRVRPRLYIAGVAYDGAIQDITGTSMDDYHEDWAQSPATGDDWTPAEVNDTQYELRVTSTSNDYEDIGALQPSVLYTAVPASEPLVRELVSKDLRLLREGIPYTAIKVGPEWAALRTFAPVPVSHALARGPGGDGWGVKPWERRSHVKLRHTLDLNAMTCDLLLLDDTALRMGLWETDVSDLGAGVARQGLPQLLSTRGVRGGATDTRVFTRASNAWCADGTGGVVQLQQGVAEHEAAGLGIYESVTPLLLQNAFVNGGVGVPTGWTRNGNGVAGSSAVIDSSAAQLFDDVTAARVVKFTAGSPPGADLELISDAFTGSAGPVWIRIYRLDAGTGVLSWLYRRGDGKYWRQSDQTWQVAKTPNPTPNNTTFSAAACEYVNPIAITGGTGTCTFGVGIPSASGVAGQINWLYYAGVEQARSVTSPIVSQGTAYARAATTLGYLCHHDAAVWIPDLSCTSCQFTSAWSASAVANGAVFTFWYVAGSSSDYESLAYDKTSAKLRYRRRVAGVNYDAYVSAPAFVRGTAHQIRTRATGEDGEQDLAPYTLDVWFDGTKGTSAVAVPHRYLTTPYTVYWGSEAAGANACNGALAYRLMQHRAPTDIEMIRLGRAA